MKRALLLFTALILSFIALAQAPQAINYQAVLRDASGTVLASQTANLRFSILQGSVTGTAVYTETHNVTTNNLGSFDLAIGNGTPTLGSFPSINWANGPYFLKTELDTGGGSFTTLSTTQFLSVPYALYAGSVANNFVGCIDTITAPDVVFLSETHTDSDNNNILDAYTITVEMDSAYYIGLTNSRIVYRFWVNGQIVAFGDNPWAWFNNSPNRIFSGPGAGIEILLGDLVKVEFFFEHLGCKAYYVYSKQL